MAGRGASRARRFSPESGGRRGDRALQAGRRCRGRRRGRRAAAAGEPVRGRRSRWWRCEVGRADRAGSSPGLRNAPRRGGRGPPWRLIGGGLSSSAGRLFKFVKNAVAHFGGGGVGEGDGDDLAGILDLAEQSEEAASEQVGFAGAGGGLHEHRLSGVEGAVALGLVGRGGPIHPMPPRYRLRQSLHHRRSR